jgi:hypothetical protein
MIVVAGAVENISTRADGSIKIVIGTQELSPEKVGSLFFYRNKLGYLAIKEASFQPSELEALTEVDEDLNNWGKSPSERLRNVLFRLFEQNKEGFEDFNQYYRSKMDTIISHLKSKIL